LVSGPAGMAVEAFTGAITWTPVGLAEIGSIPVTLQAANYAGATNWTFNITVPYPRPVPPANLTVADTTENSVTIAWAPEEAVYGPITYSLHLRHFIHDPRGGGGTVWYTQIGTNSTAPTITITGLTPGQGQDYYLVANGPGGSSGTNEFIYAKTLSVQPPLNVRMTGLTSTSISLAWDPPPGPVPAARYEVWGWYNGGLNYTSYGANITGTSLTVTGLVPGSWHQWGVRAYDAEGYASAFNYGIVVVNPIPAPAQLTAAPAMVGGQFQFNVSLGSTLQTVLIQATTNPADPGSWVQIGSLFPATNSFSFTDTNSALYPIRFYRLLSP
jgi:hypothetical protein